jgi:hypothetical protein
MSKRNKIEGIEVSEERTDLIKDRLNEPIAKLKDIAWYEHPFSYVAVLNKFRPAMKNVQVIE